MIDKLSPVSNMASSRSEENANLKHFQHLVVSQCWCVLQFCFGHFCLECLADVIANVCLAILCCLADVIAMAIFCGRCYTTRSDVKPGLFSGLNVVTTCFISCLIELTWWADFIAIDLCDWCCCHILVLVFCDWYYCHMLMFMLLFGRCYAIWCNTTSNCCIGQFLLPMADVIAIDSYVRLMLLPYYVDFDWLVLPEWLMLLWHNCNTLAITSATTPMGGFSINHHGNNISQYELQFCGNNISHSGNNTSQSKST